MSEPPITKPLQRPPGYRDPNAPPHPRLNPHLLPLSYRPTQKNHRKCKCISCCCFCYSFFSIVVLLLLVSFSLFYLWYKPKLPVFHLQSFQFQRFNVSENSDGTYINCLASVRIEIKNANEKLEYVYGGGKVRVTVGEGEGGTDLGTVSWGEFVQEEKNVTSLKFVIRTEGALVSDGVGEKLKGQFGKRDLVVNVEARTRVGFTVGGLRVRRLGVNVLCRDVKLKQLDGGDMPKCVIRTLRW